MPGRKRKTTTIGKVKKTKKTSKSKGKSTPKKKVKTNKPKLNLTPTEKKILNECEQLLKDNPNIKNKGLSKIKDLEKRLYYIKVWSITEKQPLHKLRNHKKRCFRGPKCYNLDHIVPIIYGYLNNLPPEKIGDITNLRFIKAKDNIDKGSRMTEESHRTLRRLKRK